MKSMKLFFVLSIIICITALNFFNYTLFNLSNRYKIVTYIEEDLSIDTVNIIEGAKVIQCKDYNDNTLWSIAINGVFSIENDSVQCIKAFVSKSCNNKKWAIDKQNPIINNNSASLNINAIKEGLIPKCFTQTFSISCDKTGKLF